MSERRVRTTEEALEIAFEEIRRLKQAQNQPRTRIRIESWTITENAAGDLVFTRPGSPTFIIPA